MDLDLAQVAREYETSDHWRSRIDRLRNLASGSSRAAYRRSTGPLTGLSWRELEDLAQKGRLPPAKRKRAHKSSATETDEGNRHVHDYLKGCRAAARQFGSEFPPERVHRLVCGSGYLIDMSGMKGDRPYEPGHIASSVSAHIHRRQFGSGTAANRMMAVRRKPNAAPIEPIDIGTPASSRAAAAARPPQPD